MGENQDEGEEEDQYEEDEALYCATLTFFCFCGAFTVRYLTIN